MPTVEPTPFEAVAQRTGVRGARYCEFFVVERKGVELRGKVYNTLGLNDCPGALWSAADTERLKTQLGALAVSRNGPRYFMMDGLATQSVGDEVLTLEGLTMRLVAVMRIAPSQLSSKEPYVETTIERTTEYTFLAGKLVYTLVPPVGPSYVLQSYAQIVDDFADHRIARRSCRSAAPARWLALSGAYPGAGPGAAHERRDRRH